LRYEPERVQSVGWLFYFFKGFGVNGNEIALAVTRPASEAAAKAAEVYRTMTVREVADVFGVTPEAIKKHVRELYPETIKNGVQTSLTEGQVTEIKRRMMPTTQVAGAVTHTEMMQKAAEVMAWLTAENKRMSERIAIDAPKVETYDILADRSYLRGFRDAAGTLGMRQSEFMRLLKSKYIYPNGHGGYKAYAEYADLFSLRAYAKGDVKGDQLMLTVAGIDYFRKLING
jgi:phage antirepressor YoqD-like protein